MKTVCEANKCSSCRLCEDICPKSAIHIEDGMSQYNAVIEIDKCISCGLCERKCPVNNKPEKKEPIRWVQGWSLEPGVREKSASGGFGATISRKFIQEGGTVCSCLFRNGEFVFEFTDDIYVTDLFMGSKYVKSNAYKAYKKIGELLSEGKKVLFIGLPCQVAAVRNYIPEENSGKLYLVDLICHGAPSQRVFDYFMSDKKTAWRDGEKVYFRINNKYQIGIDDKSICTKGISDSYSLAFIKNLIQPEKCFECDYAGTKRVSDLTLGDSWGNNIPGQENKGVSLAMAQNLKGIELLNNDKLYIIDVDIESAISNNDQLKGPAKKTQTREKVMREILDGKRFDYVIAKALPKDTFKQMVKKILIISKIIQV